MAETTSGPSSPMEAKPNGGEDGADVVDEL
jgi:hypothetical protein